MHGDESLDKPYPSVGQETDPPLWQVALCNVLCGHYNLKESSHFDHTSEVKVQHI